MTTETTATIIAPNEGDLNSNGAVIVELPPVADTTELPTTQADILDHEIQLAEIHAERETEIAAIQADASVAIAEAHNEGNNQWPDQIADLRAQVGALGETVVSMATVLEQVMASTPQPSQEAEAGAPEGVTDPATISSETPPEPSSTAPEESPGKSGEENPEPPAPPAPPAKARRARMI